jgi:phenylpropionate dioxygenase-like ring-hydroxylating dioxygenase large terminal subunit
MVRTETESLASDLERGWTLPASWYTDPAVLELERERIFARSWQYAGRAALVAEPGDVFATLAGHIPVAVTRDEEGVLRAFVNVCRHRGHEVVTEPGNRRTLQCPYHAWTYGLDGCLKAAPRGDHEPGFPKAELGLLPIRVDTWGPLVFVNPDLDAQPLSEILGELPALLSRSGLDLNALGFHEHREWTMNANWKVGVENYLECYHCPVAHPGFSALIDVAESSYRYSTQRWTLSQYAPVRPAALDGTSKKGVAYDAHGEVVEAQYHVIWPNCTINIDPGRANLSLDVWIPDGPEVTRGYSDQFFAPDVPEELRREMIAFSQQVGREDDALVESVQRGLRSGMVPQGRLMLGSERLIQHFQGLALEALS